MTPKTNVPNKCYLKEFLVCVNKSFINLNKIVRHLILYDTSKYQCQISLFPTPAPQYSVLFLGARFQNKYNYESFQNKGNPYLNYASLVFILKLEK